MESSSLVQTKVDFITSFLKSQVGQHHVCNTLDETVLPSLKTWDFKTENGFWLKQTFQRVVQSGLYYRWGEWAALHLQPRKHSKYEKTPVVSDVVGFSKFFCVSIIWLCVLVLAFIVACLEKNNSFV